MIRPGRAEKPLSRTSCWRWGLHLFLSVFVEILRLPPHPENLLLTMSTPPSYSYNPIPCLPASESQTAANAYRALRADIAHIEEGDASTKSLILSAKEIIKQLSARSEADHIFTYGKDENGERRSLKLDKVLGAMLTHSTGCGGEEGQRYVASAIVACREKEGHDEGEITTKQLAVWELVHSVGITWVTHFLFVRE
jgi:hypothetical protein